MNVRVVQEVTVDTEVDVNLDEVLFECWDRVAECRDGDGIRRGLSAVDAATKILASVPDAMLQRAPQSAITEVLLRLDTQRARWSNISGGGS